MIPGPGRLPEWRRWREPLDVTLGIRSTNSDFQVIEELAPDLSGDGEHDFLFVEKDGNNTAYVARKLAAFAGVPEKDVGFSGMKDRHAVTRQWFSVRRAKRDGVSWPAFSEPGVTILEVGRHHRKLRRGAHRGNRFRIALRAPGLTAHKATLRERLEDIASEGVPNYFGPQRFGIDAGNLALVGDLVGGRRFNRNRRSLAISTARSFLFNEILSFRVGRETWNAITPGELVSLAGSNSVFAAGNDIDDELERRLAEHDIHPTGTLWGTGAPLSTAAAGELELPQVLRRVDIDPVSGNARQNVVSKQLAMG